MEEDSSKVPPTPSSIVLLNKGQMLDQHIEQINNIKSSYAAIRTVVKDLMVKGTDYGNIPGVDKMVLFKPGAEKLGKLCNFTTKFECTNRIVRDDLILYEYKCQLFQHEMLVSEAEGACNSKEKKYRYETTELTKEEQTDINVLKKLKEQGVLVNKEYSGRTKYFKRSDRKDYYDIANTIMKMAEKRAYVAAILIATGLSEMFTQDMEDFTQD